MAPSSCGTDTGQFARSTPATSFSTSTASTNSRRSSTPAMPARPYLPSISNASPARADVARCRGGTARSAEPTARRQRSHCVSSPGWK